jgi:hypothetical protein
MNVSSPLGPQPAAELASDPDQPEGEEYNGRYPQDMNDETRAGEDQSEREQSEDDSHVGASTRGVGRQTSRYFTSPVATSPGCPGPR